MRNSKDIYVDINACSALALRVKSRWFLEFQNGTRVNFVF